MTTTAQPKPTSWAARYQTFAQNRSYLFPLGLLIVVVLVNYSLQENMFAPRVLNANLRSFTPLLFLAVAQALVILSGSIDLSIGVIMSLVAAVMVTRLSDDATGAQFVQVALLGTGVGLLAGALNGFLASVVRLPSFITTYATSWVYAGIALWVLPRPGGSMPTVIARAYRNLIPMGIPIGVYLIVILIVLWQLLRWTRFGAYLYAIGGNTRAAFASGVPVVWHRFITHMLAGGIAALAAVFFTLNTGSSDARIGASLTLDSIVAVVLGGTAMSGGLGGVAGAMMGVLLLGFVRNIVSFADVNTWYQPLVELRHHPGGADLARLRRPGPQPVQEKVVMAMNTTVTIIRSRLSPPVIAFLLALLLFLTSVAFFGGAQGFGAFTERGANILRISAFLGIIAAGQTLVILSGGEGIDLSVGTTVTLSAIIVGAIANKQDTMVFPALLAALALGTAIGFVNGFGVAFLKVHPLVMTLGVAGVTEGVMLAIYQGQVRGGAGPMMSQLISLPVFLGISGAVLVWIVLAVLLWLLLTRTEYGKNLYAIGINRETAYLSGVHVPSHGGAGVRTQRDDRRLWRFYAAWVYTIGLFHAGRSLSVSVDCRSGHWRYDPGGRRRLLLGHDERRVGADGAQFNPDDHPTTAAGAPDHSRRHSDRRDHRLRPPEGAETVTIWLFPILAFAARLSYRLAALGRICVAIFRGGLWLDPTLPCFRRQKSRPYTTPRCRSFVRSAFRFTMPGCESNWLKRAPRSICPDERALEKNRSCRRLRLPGNHSPCTGATPNTLRSSVDRRSAAPAATSSPAPGSSAGSITTPAAAVPRRSPTLAAPVASATPCPISPSSAEWPSLPTCRRQFEM